MVSLAGKGARSLSRAPLLLTLTGLIAAATVTPLVVVVGYTLNTGWDEISRLVLRDRTTELLWNTVRLVGGSVTLCAIVGTAAAWLVTRTSLPFARLWTVLMVAPLAVPAFVSSYAWSSIFPSLDGYQGALLVVTLAYFPFVFLPVTAALRGMDPAHEESAAALGLSGLAVFIRVVLPQLRPALLGGCLLVALHLVAEFGALQMIRFPTFSTAIYDQYRSSFNGPAANAVASVLALGCLLLLIGELRLRGHSRYDRVGRGARREHVRRRLGWWRGPAIASLLALTVVSVGVPVSVLVHWLRAGSSTTFDFSSLASTTATSLGFALVASLVVTLAAVPVAWLAVRRPGLLATAVERLTYIGTGLPGIVVALALVTISLRVLPGLYQTATMLIAAYGILFLPRAIVCVRASLAQTSPQLDDVAASLGQGQLSILRRVTLPIIAPGLGAGAALVFLGAATELTATLLLSPIGTQTLATQFWSHSSAIEYGAAAPYALVLVLISAPAAYLLTRYAENVPTT